MKKIKLSIVTLAFCSLVACGGGADNTDNSKTPSTSVPTQAPASEVNPITPITPIEPTSNPNNVTTAPTNTGNNNITVPIITIPPVVSNPSSPGVPASTPVVPPIVIPAVTTPPIVTPPAASLVIPFYGTGAHWAQGGTSRSTPLATQASSLADLGMTGFREDLYDTTTIDAFASTLIPGLGKNVTVVPMINAYPWSDPSLNGANPTEASAYAYAYQMAQYAAQKLPTLPVVEFGNEYDLDSHNVPMTNAGVNVSDYDNNTWPIWRGSLRGAYDGWRSIDKTGKTKVIATASSGFIHLGWYRGMLKGIAPDGSTGHPVVKTDIIQLHWYSDGGDFVNTWGPDGTNYNVLEILKNEFNFPVMFTEIGVNEDFSTQQKEDYITKTIPELVAAQSQYNVIGFQWYELYDDTNIGGDGNYGLMVDATTERPWYATMKAAIANSKINTSGK